MHFLRVIEDKSALQGTVFVELLPGRYKGTFWNNDSIFFDEETFGFFEAIIEHEAPDYDHYSFTEISRPKWLRIVARLRVFAAELRAVESWQSLPTDTRFLFSSTEAKFAENLEAHAHALADASAQLSAWLEQVLAKQDAVTVLGI